MLLYKITYKASPGGCFLRKTGTDIIFDSLCANDINSNCEVKPELSTCEAY